jgi:hypothetical protein
MGSPVVAETSRWTIEDTCMGYPRYLTPRSICQPINHDSMYKFRTLPISYEVFMRTHVGNGYERISQAHDVSPKEHVKEISSSIEWLLVTVS